MRVYMCVYMCVLGERRRKGGKCVKTVSRGLECQSLVSAHT